MSSSHVYRNPGCCYWWEKPRVVLERRGCIQGFRWELLKQEWRPRGSKRKQSYLLSLDWWSGCLRPAGTSQKAQAASLWLEVSLSRMSHPLSFPVSLPPRHTPPSQLQAGVCSQWIHSVLRACGHSCRQKTGPLIPKGTCETRDVCMSKSDQTGGYRWILEGMRGFILLL